eukprot:gnl/Carplike_NY0171/12566_a18170_95.p1 GENE.gnl/Carplike_NY0171/12566_a18170_95~~gnl/Carplike_NY0171/12566_a18170_95.p1  ORF type:complete len:182 (-),score=56.95 gnl/Carplike_NY0171/12566_a18170_95:429-893(-)
MSEETEVQEGTSSSEEEYIRPIPMHHFQKKEDDHPVRSHHAVFKEKEDEVEKLRQRSFESDGISENTSEYTSHGIPAQFDEITKQPFFESMSELSQSETSEKKDIHKKEPDSGEKGSEKEISGTHRMKSRFEIIKEISVGEVTSESGDLSDESL